MSSDHGTCIVIMETFCPKMMLLTNMASCSSMVNVQWSWLPIATWYMSSDHGFLQHHGTFGVQFLMTDMTLKKMETIQDKRALLHFTLDLIVMQTFCFPLERTLLVDKEQVRASNQWSQLQLCDGVSDLWFDVWQGKLCRVTSAEVWHAESCYLFGHVLLNIPR